MPRPTHIRRVVVALALVLVFAEGAAAQETVTITLPSAVTFTVLGSGTVTGLPNPTTVAFANAVLTAGKVLRISVTADSASFSGPTGSSYPASAVSWTASNASGGVASSGTLSSGSYTQVFQSNTLTLSGSVDLQWRLTPSGTVRAGTHTLTLRWKVESVQP